MPRKTVNVAYGQICIRTSQEVIDKRAGKWDVRLPDGTLLPLA